MHARSGGVDPGRDGCRVPLPWGGTEPPFGFSPTGARGRPWLTQPAHWAGLTVEAQVADPGSMLNLYRAALRIRRSEPGLGDGALRWVPAPPGVLAFRRGDDFLSMTNLSNAAVPLPPHRGVLLASAHLSDAHLPPDSSVWLRPDRVSTDAAWRLPDDDR
jgi:alpha-glucosidase